MVVDRNSPLPIYIQIQEILRSEIIQKQMEGETYTTGALAERFGVNRLTVRQALQGLINEGLVYSVKGVGTVVSQARPIEDKGNYLSNFFESWKQQGHEINTVIKQLEWIQAPPQIASLLDMPGGAQLLYINRIRFADGAPLSIDYRYVKRPMADCLTPEKVQANVLRNIIAQECGIQWDGWDVEISVATATLQQARELGVRQGSPLLVRRSVLCDVNRQKIICGTSYFRGDRYKWTTYVNQLK